MEGNEEPADSVSAEEMESVPLHFDIPRGMTSRYAHHMLVQATEFEVTLSFFEVKAPLVLGDIETQREILKRGVTAECVARVTVAKARYPDFLKALRDLPLEPLPKET